MECNNVWDVHKYLVNEPSDSFVSRIPNLRTNATNPPPSNQTNQQKSELLYKTFFKPASDQTFDTPPGGYPKPVCGFTNITNEQVDRAIARLAPYKAPGPNGVCNIVFTKCANILAPHLGPVFRATFTQKHYPDQWKLSSTVVLRKPGQPDYTLTKAYRPIALLDTMAKILSSCVADEISYLAETHGMLPPTHFGGRPGRTTVDSIHLFSKFAHDAWAHPKEKYVSALFLDVKAAFPSIVIKKLLHNMRMRGLPPEYIGWYKRRLTGRRTTLTFDDFTSDPFSIPTGLDQGCPLSPIAFLFYNADLIGLADGQKDMIGLGFIDDTAFMARGGTLEEANGKLKTLMEKEGGALSWGNKHEAEFELDKTALLCVTRGREPDPTNRGKSIPVPRPSITIQGHCVEPQRSCKFLGVIIDKELRFKEHAAYAIAKGTKYVLASGRMSRTTKGLKGRLMKRLFEAVAIPKMLYAIDTWGTELLRKGRGKREKGWGARGFAKQINKVQRLAAILITGGMRTTATDTLLAHADLLPTILLIRKHCHRAALRMATLPSNHPITKHVKSALRNRKRHKSPLHRLFSAFRIDVGQLETINPVRHHPKWKPNVIINMADDPADAILQDVRAEIEEDVCLHSDSSGFEGKIGGAAVLRRRGEKKKTLKFHLGSETQHTVYKGEEVGMILAAELL